MRFVFWPIFMAVSMLGCQQPNSSQTENQEESKLSMTPEEASQSSTKAFAPPLARKDSHRLDAHGQSRVDYYYWMRDDSRTNAEVIDHLEAENHYTDSVMAHTEPMQERLFAEINDRMKKDDATVPVKYRNHFYYRRYEGELEYPIYARKKDSLLSPEQVILDGNLMAEGQEYFSIGDYAVSTNENILAYSVDTQGRRIYSIRFKNLETGELLDDSLELTTGEIVWANDNQTVFYIKKDPQTLLGYQVYRHKLGKPQDQDVLVYEETDTSFYTWLEKTKDDAFVNVVHGSTVSQGLSYINANEPTAKFQLFSPIEENLEYSIAVKGDWFYILTNWQAKNFRVMRVKRERSQDKEAWQEVVAHRENVLLQSFELFNEYMVVSEKEKGQSRLRVHNLNDKRSHIIEFDDAVYTAAIDANLSMDTSVVRVRYSSLTTPLSIYDYSMDKRALSLLKQDEVLGGFEPANYASERIFVDSRDGKQIPVSLVYRKDSFRKDGTNPLYLYAYGSYGYNIEPYFSGARLSLLDRGFVFAIAHVRGSQTLGRHWYDDGKMLNKRNTFNDFIDVTKALPAQNYAASDKIFAAGGSAGGLLIGAVINMAPELYRGVVAHVPFVDVVTTMSDPSIPLTTNEYDEWGNPADPEAYAYMLSYSPYDNVVRQAYPNILVTTGFHDSQVQYFEPAKWVAKLRELKANDNKLVFKVNMEAGHGGASGRFRRNRERALEYAFFMDLIGISE